MVDVVNDSKLVLQEEDRAEWLGFLALLKKNRPKAPINGILIARSEQIREVTYLVHNAASDARDVIIEHPLEDGWKLNSEVKPVETSASSYRFRAIAQPAHQESPLCGVAAINRKCRALPTNCPNL